MGLTDYLRCDNRLFLLSGFAEGLYNQASLVVHNFAHAKWDAEKIVIIGESESYSSMPILVAAALMHDTGVSCGSYKDHAKNSALLAKDYLPTFGFEQKEVVDIATAVAEHDGFEQSTDASRMLFDADTLNKSGFWGIDQYLLVMKEFKLSLPAAAQRFVPSHERAVSKGFYTDAAKEIDQQMGLPNRPGLALSLSYWKEVDKLLCEGKLPESEIIKKAREKISI